MDFATVDRSLEHGLKLGLPMIWRHKLLFALSALVLFFAIMLSTLALQPKFEGSTVLLARADLIPGGSGEDSRNPRASTNLTQATQSTFIEIATSDVVIRNAAEAVGISKLFPVVNTSEAGLFLRLRSWLFGSPLPQVTRTSAIDPLLPLLRRALSVKAEPNSEIIKISYRNNNPIVASEFANAVAHSLIERQIAVYSRPGVATFFERQKQRFENEYQQASNELANFSISTGTYSAEDQRKLLLGRLSELKATLATANDSIVRQTAQRQTLGSELRNIAPVARSPWVSSMVEKLAGPSGSEGSSSSVPLNDPPLLLVRVYQDSMVDLFKINSDIAGNQASRAELLKELALVTESLNALTHNAERFMQLQRKVNQAAANVDVYARRMEEEQMSDASNVAKFSSLRVIQPATVPLRPVFPNYIIMLVAAGLLSILGAFGIVAIRTIL